MTMYSLYSLLHDDVLLVVRQGLELFLELFHEVVGLHQDGDVATDRVQAVVDFRVLKIKIIRNKQ